MRDDRVQVNLESGDEVVIIEGRAAALHEQHASLWADTYNKKYQWDMPTTCEDVWKIASVPMHCRRQEFA